MASGSTAVIYVAPIGSALVSVTRFITADVTSSAAMMAEDIHSLVATGNQGPLLRGSEGQGSELTDRAWRRGARGDCGV